MKIKMIALLYSGSCGFSILVCYVREKFTRGVYSLVLGRKPANKLCGKRCGSGRSRRSPPAT